MGQLFAHARRFPKWLCATGCALRDMITGVDGQTVAPSRVYWLAASFTTIALSWWHVVVLGKDFNCTDFGTGMGLVLAAGGAAVWATHKTEPKE